MSKDEIMVIPQTTKEFVNNYPHVAREIATRKNINEYNRIRENIKIEYPHLINFMDSRGIVKQTRIILYYLNELGHDSINN